MTQLLPFREDMIFEETHEPVIAKYPFGADLGDDPSKHRWRATWDGYDGKVRGIALTAHPVVRATECGAWIDPYAYYQATKQPWEEGAPAHEWVTSDNRRLWKWVSNSGSQAWAKTAQDIAVHSLAVRLDRWARHVRSDVLRVRQAATALGVLRPDLRRYAKQADASMDFGGMEN